MNSEVLEFFERLKAYSPDSASYFLNEAKTAPQPNQAGAIPGFEIGEGLQQAIGEISACATDLLRLTKPPLTDRVQDIRSQLEQITTRIAIVGQIKAGKSSVINALGARPEYLPTHVNPWTAVPTNLYFGVPGQPRSGAFFEFFGPDEWHRLGLSITAPIARDGEPDFDAASQSSRSVWRRANVRIGDRFHHLLGNAHRYKQISPKTLAHYLCAGPPVHQQSRTFEPGRYADITRVAHVYLPPEPFATPTILIDTPGLNDPSFIRMKTTQSILEHADLYIVVLSASQPMSLADITLLRTLRGLEKRRLLVFINRIDELSGGPEDVRTVENHVRKKLKAEFPDAVIPVVSGSANWANTAIDGVPGTVRQLMKNGTLQSHLAHKSPLNDASTGLDELRVRIFEASGVPTLIWELSELMLAGFLATDGQRLTETLKSAAELSASTARQEIASLKQMITQSEASADPFKYNMVIAQLEKRLRDTESVRANVSAAVKDSKEQIRQTRARQISDMRDRFSTIIHEFSDEQKRLLPDKAATLGTTRWRCDTTILVRRLEMEFISLLSKGLEAIEAVHDQCIDQVKAYLEQSHSQEAAPQLRSAHTRQPDLRKALPALGKSIEIEIGRPWWAAWWGSDKTPEDKAQALKSKILAEFLPLVDRLAALAEAELTAFSDYASATLSDTVTSTVSGITARLQDLKSRLTQHIQHGQQQRLETLNDDYGRSYKELTAVKSNCETIIRRLEGLGEKQPS